MTTTFPTTPDGYSLRDQRRALGVTQRQLATLAGCSLTFLANVEAGLVPRRSEVVPRIVAALQECEQRAEP